MGHGKGYALFNHSWYDSRAFIGFCKGGWGLNLSSFSLPICDGIEQTTTDPVAALATATLKLLSNLGTTFALAKGIDHGLFREF